MQKVSALIQYFELKTACTFKIDTTLYSFDEFTTLCPPFIKNYIRAVSMQRSEVNNLFFIADFNIFIAWLVVKQHECPSSSC